MTNVFTLIFFFLAIAGSTASAQSLFRVMSYNTENFFDTTDNPATDDDEFLPDGKRRWSMKRYRRKMLQIARVITAAGEWDAPALIALCEIENDTVAKHLIERSPLKRRHYRYAITHGSDRRGINNALLYRRDKFSYIGSNEYHIALTRRKHKRTRNILHVWGRVVTGDTLDVFVCHFPSRYGGEKESEADRFNANRVLRHLCDSLFLVRTHPNIIIMGDFNATEDDRSIAEVLGAGKADGTHDAHRLYNLSTLYNKENPKGTYKFRGEWSRLDHIIVSGNLISPDVSMRYVPGSFRVFAPPFILTRDKIFRGERPLRTYNGFKYEGGFSDHLPVVADFIMEIPL